MRARAATLNPIAGQLLLVNVVVPNGRVPTATSSRACWRMAGRGKSWSATGGKSPRAVKLPTGVGPETPPPPPPMPPPGPPPPLPACTAAARGKTNCRCRTHQCRAVRTVDKQGNALRSFCSITDAAEALGLTGPQITRVATPYYIVPKDTMKGHRFQFLNEEKKSKSKAVLQVRESLAGSFSRVVGRVASPRVASRRLASPRVASRRIASHRLASRTSPRVASPRIAHLLLPRGGDGGALSSSEGVFYGRRDETNRADRNTFPTPPGGLRGSGAA